MIMMSANAARVKQIKNGKNARGAMG